jgi:hypothetical protein
MNKFKKRDILTNIFIEFEKMRGGMGSKTGIDGSDDSYCCENPPISSKSSIDSNRFPLLRKEKNTFASIIEN